MAQMLCACQLLRGDRGHIVAAVINAQYSIVSRMEAVVVREHCLKLHQECKNIRQPTDIIRHLEDEFSRAEAKLTNFSELKLSEADRCSVLLQALGFEVRQYVDSLRKSEFAVMPAGHCSPNTFDALVCACCNCCGLSF